MKLIRLTGKVLNEPVSSSEERSIPQLKVDVLGLGAENEEESCTQEEILVLLQDTSWRSIFPAKLKTRYHAYLSLNQKKYRLLAPVLLLLYFPLAATVTHHLPEGSFIFWLTIDIWIPVLLMGALIFTLIPALDRWYQVYIGSGSAISISITIIVLNVFPLGAGTIVAYAAIMYSVLAVYCFVGLRFSSALLALLAGWFGGLLGVIGTYRLGADMDWLLLHQTFTCTSIFGMGLAYTTDRRERNKFLQTYLLQLCLVGSEALSKRLEELSRQDALTGLDNRRYLNEKMDIEWSRELRHREPLTLMMIDVDFF